MDVLGDDLGGEVAPARAGMNQRHGRDGGGNFFGPARPRARA